MEWKDLSHEYKLIVAVVAMAVVAAATAEFKSFQHNSQVYSLGCSERGFRATAKGIRYDEGRGVYKWTSSDGSEHTYTPLHGDHCRVAKLTPGGAGPPPVD